MAKYVDVDAMLKRVCMDCGCIGDECNTCEIGPLLSSVAPEEDVVKVVRCGDCICKTQDTTTDKFNGIVIRCLEWDCYMPTTGYCHLGARNIKDAQRLQEMLLKFCAGKIGENNTND